MRAYQRKLGFRFMIKLRRAPIGGSVTRVALAAPAAVVYVIRLMAAYTLGNRVLENLPRMGPTARCANMGSGARKLRC